MLGNSITFSVDSLSLTVAAENFDGLQYQGTGYRRYQKTDQLLDVSESFCGASLVDGVSFEPKFQFDWTLQLLLDDYLTFEAIFLTQQENGRDTGSIPVRFIDERFPLLVSDSLARPRTRAKKGSTGITTPTGFEFIWPQFDVLLSRSPDSIEHFGDVGDGNYLYRVKMQGSELGTVGTGEDIA